MAGLKTCAAPARQTSAAPARPPQARRAKMTVRVACALCGGFLVFASALGARPPDVLRSAGAIPANLAGRFRGAVGFQQSASGQYFVFDRGGHTVYGID